MYRFFQFMNIGYVTSGQHCRWFNGTIFNFAGDDGSFFTETEFFTDLVNSPAYRNAYVPRDAWHAGSGGAHGPFALSRITPEKFVPLEYTHLQKRARQVMYRAEFYPPDRAATMHVEGLMDAVPRSAYFYELALVHDWTHFSLPGFQMDFEWSKALAEFKEFLAINLDGQELYLMVFGMD